MLVTIEGIDGAGKSTLAAALAERLGLVLLREPGGVELSERIRSLVKDPALTVSGRADQQPRLAVERRHRRAQPSSVGQLEQAERVRALDAPRPCRQVSRDAPARRIGEQQHLALADDP